MKQGSLVLIAGALLANLEQITVLAYCLTQQRAVSACAPLLIVLLVAQPVFYLGLYLFYVLQLDEESLKDRYASLKWAPVYALL